MFTRVSKLVLVGFFGLTALSWMGQAASADGGSANASAPYASRRGRGSAGFVTALQTKVGLTPEQMDQVRGLLAEQRQEVSALREKTDAKIRSVLTTVQQPKFDAYLVEIKSRRSQGS